MSVIGGTTETGNHATPRILLVDDDGDVRRELALVLRTQGYVVDTVADGFRALARIEALDPDVVVSDVRMAGMDGLTLLGRVRAADADRGVILLSGFADVPTAVQALHDGATDFLQKPCDIDHLLATVDQAARRRRLRGEQRQLGGSDAALRLGQSPAMRAVHALVERVAPTSATVLIEGETGTGKELVAGAIHTGSRCAKGPFVRLHCAALADTLLESELFGHERGAFTGAIGQRDGRFQQAHGGTLFLDEVGEIPPSTQVKLLRFLQEREFQRVGGNQAIKVDVRIVAATNRVLEREVKAGRFREDLYYRLNVVRIEMPPLRERGDDVLALAAHFLERFATVNERACEGFSDQALERIAGHKWPGNVRELENAIEHAVVVSAGPRIEAQDLPSSLQQAVPRIEPQIPGASLADIERYAILRTLEHTGGCKTHAARILGISHRKIQYKVHDYGNARSALPQDDSTLPS